MDKTFKLSEEIKKEFLSNETSRHLNAQPPKLAYFYLPKGRDVVEYDEKNQYKTTRRIFDAGVEFLSFEIEKLKELRSEIEMYNSKNVKKLSFPPNWMENNTLRFLQATAYNHAKTIEYLIAHLEFREKTFPIRVSDKIIEILNLGFLYGHGRDQRFRPLLVINAKVYKKYKDTYMIEEWVTAVMYFMEYLVNKLLVPGQVENWNTICDVDEVSVVFLPGNLKKIIEILQCNYRARLNVMYIMNISFFIKAFWNMIKGMLDPNTEKKIKMIGSDKNPMFEFINKNQVEIKFGGTAKNIESHFFPHIIPDASNLNEKENKNKYLMDENHYCEFIEKNNQYVRSPYIDFEKKLEENKIIFEVPNDSIGKFHIFNLRSKKLSKYSNKLPL